MKRPALLRRVVDCRSMTNSATLLPYILVLLLASATVDAQQPAVTTRSRGTGSLERARQTLDGQQPVFIENKGQWDTRARFLLHTGGLDMWVTDHGVVYDLHTTRRAGSPLETSPRVGGTASQLTERTGHVVRMSFEGTGGGSIVRGTEQQQGVRNFFIGNDPSRWATDVHGYRGARIERLYEGVDAVFYLDGGRPRYDLVVAPGASTSQVAMKFDGADRIGLRPDGSLAIGTSMGDLKQQGLYAYQLIAGERRQVACAFTMRNDGRVGFTTGSYDRSKPLVIDPLIYSTFLGSNGFDQGEAIAIAVDGSGNIYMTGVAGTSSFPTTSGAYDIGHNGGGDVFVTKLDPSASGSAQLVYSTFLGGNSEDIGFGIAIDGSGNIHVAGRTVSNNFPTTSGAYDAGYNGSNDVFVAKLDPSGSGSAQLVYSTYLGATGSDAANAIAIDGSGNMYVTGSTRSSTFPITGGAYDNTYFAGDEVFIAKLDPSASGSSQLAYSTFLGGSGNDVANAIAVDGSGNVYLTGRTALGCCTGEYPVTSSAYDPLIAGLSSEVFVSKVDPSASGAAQLVYSTFLGEDGAEIGLGIAIDDSGKIYVTGSSNGSGFPTTSGAYDTGVNGGTDIFAAKLDPSASGSSSLEYSTFLGGTGNDAGNAIAIDGSGNIYMTGITASTDFPTTSGAYDTGYNGSSDVFVAKLVLSASGSAQLAYSTFLGGSSTDLGNSIAVDGSGEIYVTGNTSSSGFPTTSGAFDTGHNGASDVFATKLSIGGTITLNAPNGGETWCAGSTHTVTWTATSITNVRLELSSDGGSTWPTTIVSSTSASTGSYGWSIAGNQAAGSSYRIRASDASNSSVYDASNASFTINVPPSFTDDPDDVTTTAFASGGASFSVSATGTPAPTMQWQVSTNGGSSWSPISGATSSSYSISPGDLTASLSGNQYRAVLTNSCSSVNSQSATLTVDKASAGITLASLGHVYDGTSKTATATTSPGGLAVNITYQQSGSPVTSPTGAGSYDVDAVIDDANYQGTATGTLVIDRATLTVTAENRSKIYGEPNPALSAGYTGFVEGEDASVLSGSPELATTATSASGTGVYPITAGVGTLAADNYSFTFADASLTITAAPLSVVAADAEKTCGAANPSLTGTITGIRNSDAITASYSTTATSSSTAGSYVIVPLASGAALGNYSVTYVSGTLTVNPPAIATHPADQDIVAGNSASFSASVSGSASVQWQTSTDGGWTWSDITGATSTTYSLTTSLSQSGTQYRALFDNGTCSSATFAATLTVKVNATDLGPAVLFLGVSNSSSNNRDIDLKVELYKNSTLISSGTVTGEKISGTNQNSSRKYTVPLEMTNGAVSFGPSDELHVKVYARRNGGTGDFATQLWYNDNPSPSVNQGNKGWARVGNETEGGTNTGYLYLRGSSVLSTATGSSGTSIEKTLGTSWELFDTWTMSGSNMKAVRSDEVTGSASMQVTPNPSYTGMATLRLMVSKPGNTVVTVHDALGRLLRQGERVPIESAGEVLLPLDLSALPSGVYTVRMVIGGETVTAQVILLR